MPEREEQDRAAGCADVTELLPVYLNRSLEAEEIRRLEAHLAGCPACRQEEHDTRTALALYEGHLPVELILDLALEQPMSSRCRAVVESHLAACARCSEEVALVREQHSTGEPPFRRPQSTGQASHGRLWTLAWAASIAAVVASAGWIWTWRQLVDQRALPAAQTARANLSVVELLPATQSPLRGDADPRAAANRVVLPEDLDQVVLVLLSGGRSCESGCILEIYQRGDTQPKRRVDGLVASPDGHVTLALPGDWLSSGRSILAIRDLASGDLAVEYLVEIPPSGR